tara:strand:- start:158 stop:301 length:144 start_codon:yes stop_codon:yes gene_type:complete
MINQVEEENEVSERNYEDKKSFYNREFIESANLIVGIGILLFIILKK